MRMVDSILQALTCDFSKNTSLYMYRGKLRPVANSGRMAIHSVLSEPVQQHSQKLVKKLFEMK